MAAAQVGPVLSNGLQPLSCQRCSHRKVRCDRIVPCSNCSKHGVHCAFPQPKTERRQRRKAILSSSSSSPPSSWNKPQNRHDRYEKVPKGFDIDLKSTADLPQDLAAAGYKHDTSPRQETVASAAAGGGRLIVHGKRSRYVQSNLWTRVESNLDAIALLADSSSDEDENGTPESVSEYTASRLSLGLLPNTSLTGKLYSLQQHFQQLWQVYLSNIHPVTMILHAPSAGEVLCEAVRKHGYAEKDIEILLFATMACALTSITDANCMQSLGEQRSVLFARYRLACEVALVNANFLMSSSFGVLQAYVIYLVAITQYTDPDELWNLTGIAKRNAKRLGLDQERFPSGLTPFEMEMRRRLWCQIAINDSMAAQNVGFYRPDTDSHMTVPSNVNDIDISPGMKDAPLELVGATDMIFCNLRYKLMKFMGEVNGGRRPWILPAEEQRTLAVDEAYRAEREKSIARIEEHLELELLRYCDMLNPVHCLTVVVARLTLYNLRYTALRPFQYGKDPNDFTEEHRRLLFSKALKALEYENNANSQPFIQGFFWHMHQYPQWTCIIQVLEELTIQHHGEQVERAWQQLCVFYESRPSLFQKRHRKPPLHKTVDKMMIKAWESREKQALEYGQVLLTPSCITLLRERGCHAKTKFQAPTSEGITSGGSSHTLRNEPNERLLQANKSLEHDSASLPNWTDLDLAVADELENDMNFLESTLHEDTFTPAFGQNRSLYQLQSLPPSFNPHTQN